jgi:hypothetical protein
MKFLNVPKSVYQKPLIEEGQTIKLPKTKRGKGQTMINKALHLKLRSG